MGYGYYINGVYYSGWTSGGGYSYGGGDGGGEYTVTYDGCANDDSVTDSYDDTCSEWYDSNPDTCGMYDTDTFSAWDSCCACMGYGYYINGVYYSGWTGGGGYGYGYGDGGGGEYTVTYDGCANDDSVTDSYDDTCSEWYDSNPDTCGMYDTDTFSAWDSCCACMGYGYYINGVYYSGWTGGGGYGYGGGEGGYSTVTYDGCTNDDSVTDSYDDTCSEWYDTNPDTCGMYDSDTFSAFSSCCACMGYGYYINGVYYSGWTGGYGYGGGEGGYTTVTYDGCTNDDSVTDSYDDTCSEWYDTNPDTCGMYDSDTFSAFSSCCACMGYGYYINGIYYSGWTGGGGGYYTGGGGGEGGGEYTYTYDGCTNDDSVTDSYDDTCSEWYDSNPDTCGMYDTDAFSAWDSCCACMGYGYYINGVYYTGYWTGGGGGGGGGGTTVTVTYDGCTNDDSVVDSYDDTCSEWYDSNPDTCGVYDTDTFSAWDSCCACMGYGYYINGVYYMGWVPPPPSPEFPEEPAPEPVVYPNCVNDDSVGDSYDDTCTEWYDYNPSTCGQYDTDTFIASELCCACIPGDVVPPVDPIVYPDCVNDDSVGDSYDDTCTEWYDYNPDTCGMYDTDAFSAEALCCACDPMEEPVPEPEPTPEPVTYPDCVNDDSVGDSYDDTCTEWYDANPDTCGVYDTDVFVAADLCCACIPGEEPLPPAPETEPVVYPDCVNDDSVGDSYDDTCSEWYDANPDTCGVYDTDAF